MAKQLWFTDNAPTTHRAANTSKLTGTASWWWPYKLSETRGDNATGTLNSVATPVLGTTLGIEVVSSGLPVEWLSEPLSADFTIAGTITANLWALETDMGANAAINFAVDKIDAASGSLTQIVKSARVTELGTAAAAANFTATPTSTACKRGDRLRVRVFASDAGTMAALGTVPFYYDRSTAAVQGDSWIQFTENLTFETTAPTGSTYYLTDTAETINPFAPVEKKAATTRGGSSVNAVTNTVAGPTGILPVTVSAGGSAIDWYTPPLEAFTLGGLVKVNVRAFESNAAANASLRVAIAIVNTDGTGPVAWSLACIEPSTVSGELGTSDAAVVAWVAGDDVAIAAGKRLRFQIHLDDLASGPLVAGHTVTVSYNGASANAAGDTYVTLPITVVEQPTGPTTHFGATSSSFSFNRVTAARKETFAATATPLTLSVAVAGIGAAPAVTHYGAVTAPWAFGATTAAKRRTTGQVAVPVGFAAATTGRRKTFSSLAAPFTLSRAVAAQRKTFGQISLPITWQAATQGISTAGAVTHYGIVTAPFTFLAATQATRKTTSSLAAPFTLSIAAQGRRQALGQLTAPFTFVAVTAARRKAFGQLVAPYTFGAVTAGRRRTTSSLTAPFTFAKAVAAQRKTFGQTVAPFTFGAVTSSRKQYARTSTTITFSAATTARKQTYGIITAPFTFGAITQGIGFTGAQTFFGATSTTITFTATTSARKKTFAVVARPITFTKAVQGRKQTFGVIARPITFTALTQGKRTTRGQLTATFTLARAVQAQRKTHGRVLMPITLHVATQGVSTIGAVTHYAQFVLPITLTITTGPRAQVPLNLADMIYLGEQPADRVYAGSTQVWP